MYESTTTDTLDEFIAMADQAGIYGSALDELTLDADRACAILRYALRADSVRNVAGFTLARFRDGFDPRTRSTPSATRYEPRDPLPEHAAMPTLAQIEHAWSLDAYGVLDLMARVIRDNGGFAAFER